MHSEQNRLVTLHICISRFLPLSSFLSSSRLSSFSVFVIFFLLSLFSLSCCSPRFLSLPPNPMYLSSRIDILEFTIHERKMTRTRNGRTARNCKCKASASLAHKFLILGKIQISHNIRSVLIGFFNAKV